MCFIAGDKVLVAVKKQATVEPVLITFPENVLLDVAPPADKAEDYALPDDILEEGTANEFPLFDGKVWCDRLCHWFSGVSIHLFLTKCSSVTVKTYGE